MFEKNKEASMAGLEGMRRRVKKMSSEIMGYGLYRIEPYGPYIGYWNLI